MEQEARERLARVIPLEDQDRLGVEIALRTGGPGMDAARALLDDGACAVLVLR